MATRKSATNGSDPAAASSKRGSPNADGAPAVSPRSAVIAAAGVQTGEDFANLMSALMSDVIEGNVSPNVANATVNAGGKLLKVVEMQYKYGSPKESKPMTLTLAPGRP